MKGFLGFVVGVIVISHFTRPTRTVAMKKALEPLFAADKK